MPNQPMKEANLTWPLLILMKVGRHNVPTKVSLGVNFWILIFIILGDNGVSSWQKWAKLHQRTFTKLVISPVLLNIGTWFLYHCEANEQGFQMMCYLTIFINILILKSLKVAFDLQYLKIGIFIFFLTFLFGCFIWLLQSYSIILGSQWDHIDFIIFMTTYVHEIVYFSSIFSNKLFIG